MPDITSEKPLGACLFSITAFDGNFDTRPAYEVIDSAWPVITANVAPADGPVLVEDKNNAPYFVPCGLRDAPYIGKTRERALREGWPSLIGKQRSAQHCMESAILKWDIDGLPSEQWQAVQEKMKSSGLTFLAYSTWSYGLAEKPGERMRILLPMDRALDQVDYELAWWGAAEALFAELIGGALDTSAAKICQQQGVWSTAPEREHLAFRINIKGRVASADALIALGKVKHCTPPLRKATLGKPLNHELSLPPDIPRLTAAHCWIVDDYETWIKVGQCFKALTPALGEEAAYQLWRGYSERGSHKTHNDTPAYAPETKWGTFYPSITVDAALGTVYALARDGVLAALEADRGKAVLSERGHAASRYLATHHRALFSRLNKGVA